MFQGTVLEDATAGTHVTSLTVTPGVGSELFIYGGSIIEGNTATSQTALVLIDDGTNALFRYLFVADTSASIEHDFPTNTIPATNVSNGITGTLPFTVLSGAMRLILRVTTTAVSVTQTFAFVGRIKGPGLPTTTLADTVGTPTLTQNTDRPF